MNIRIYGINMTVNEKVQEYVEKKLGRLDRYLPHITEARVDLGMEHRRSKEQPVAQLTVRNDRGVILRAEDKTQKDIFASIDLVVDKMYRQIQRYKGKTQKRRGGERWLEDDWSEVEEVPVLVEEVAEDLDYDEQPESPIVRRKNVMLTPMSELEAIDQMELLGHKFFLFYNGEEDTVNVLYKREDGNYGILTPRLD